MRDSENIEGEITIHFLIRLSKYTPVDKGRIPKPFDCLEICGFVKKIEL